MNKKKVVMQCLLGFFVGIIAVTSVSAAILLQADEVSYTNTLSKENVQNTKEALDELYKLSKDHCPEGYICKKGPKSFADDDWDTMAQAVRSNDYPYNVGDTKCVALDGFSTTNNNGCSDGEFAVRIANTSTPAECSEDDFSQSACGFVLEFADIISKHNMNPGGEYQGTQYDYGWNKDGFPASSMHTYLENDIYNTLPSTLRNAIIPTKVVSSHGSADTTNFTTTENLYLLSAHEVWEDDTSDGIDYYDTSYNNTRQLDYYKNLGVSTSNYSGAIKQYKGSNLYWFLRSAWANDDYRFIGVYINGYWYYYYANLTTGISPAFRIG